MKLLKTILLLMLIASAVPTALLGVLVVASNRDKLTTNAQELAQERVTRLRLQIANALGETRRVVESAAASELTRVDDAARQQVLAALLSARDELRVVTVLDASGMRRPNLRAMRRGDRSAEEVARHDDAVRAVVARGPIAAEYSDAYAVGDGAAAVTLAVPLQDDVRGGRWGYLAAEIGLDPLDDLLRTARFGSRGVAYLVNERGQLVAHPDRAPMESALSSPAVAEFVRNRAALFAGAARVRDFADEGVLAACAALVEPPWLVVAEQPRSDAYLLVRRMGEQALGGLAISLVLALLLATGFARMVTRPLKNFTDGALKIARGVFGVEVDVKAKNELGELASTFNYMSKQLLAYDSETRGLYDSLERGYLETLFALAQAIDSKDAYTRGHSQRVGELAADIGREMGLPPREVKWLLYGGILHDIGKIGISEPILCKKSQLTPEELAVMREHPAIGAQIIEAVTFLASALPAVRSHHERWDGSGYPDKLKGEEIPLAARIVNCADTWDACTSDRPYQKAMLVDRALAIMRNLTGAQIDPAVTEALERVIRQKQARGERVTMAEEPAPATAANS